jgi:hypothetical protein
MAGENGAGAAPPALKKQRIEPSAGAGPNEALSADEALALIRDDHFQPGPRPSRIDPASRLRLFKEGAEHSQRLPRDESWRNYGGMFARGVINASVQPEVCPAGGCSDGCSAWNCVSSCLCVSL